MIQRHIEAAPLIAKKVIFILGRVVREWSLVIPPPHALDISMVFFGVPVGPIDFEVEKLLFNVPGSPGHLRIRIQAREGWHLEGRCWERGLAGRQLLKT